MEWIKCSETIPDIGDRVLVVLSGKYVHEANYCQWSGAKTERGRAPRFENARGVLHGVTHWMPLQEPPQEVN